MYYSVSKTLSYNTGELMHRVLVAGLNWRIRSSSRRTAPRNYCGLGTAEHGQHVRCLDRGRDDVSGVRGRGRDDDSGLSIRNR